MMYRRRATIGYCAGPFLAVGAVVAPAASLRQRHDDRSVAPPKPTVESVQASGNSYSLPGGWTYAATGGLVIDPSSNSEFQNTLGNILGFDPQAVAGGTVVGLGAFLSMPVNVSAMALNYLRDRRIPYSAPTNCDGPTYHGGSLHSCTGVTISCKGILDGSQIDDELALKIDDLPNVSDAFRKCMKGRFRCNGSHHPRLRVKCDDYGSCGPCFYDSESVGCNLGGRDIWYCNGTTNPCLCAQTVFHEASHACGAQDFIPHDANYSSYRIGAWFRDACFGLYPPP